MIRRPPRSTLFPYPTLFRSQADISRESGLTRSHVSRLFTGDQKAVYDQDLAALLRGEKRSEEHTSELQSHLNLVCRLLLEKIQHALGKPPPPARHSPRY